MAQKSGESTSWTMIPPNVNSGETSFSDSRALRARFIRSRQMLMDTTVPQRWKPNALPARRAQTNDGLCGDKPKKFTRHRNSLNRKERKSSDDSNNEDQLNTLRLATDLPGFNWLEDKIINGDLPTYTPNRNQNATTKSPPASLPTEAVPKSADDECQTKAEETFPKIICSGSLLDCYVELCNVQKCFDSPTETNTKTSNLPGRATITKIQKINSSRETDTEFNETVLETTSKEIETRTLTPPPPDLDTESIETENTRPITPLKPIDSSKYQASTDLPSPASCDLEIIIEPDYEGTPSTSIQEKRSIPSPSSNSLTEITRNAVSPPAVPPANEVKQSVALLPKKRRYDPSPPCLELAVTPPLAPSPPLTHPKKGTKMARMEEIEYKIEKIPNLATQSTDNDLTIMSNEKSNYTFSSHNNSKDSLSSFAIQSTGAATLGFNVDYDVAVSDDSKVTTTNNILRYQSMPARYANPETSQCETQVTSPSLSRIGVRSVEMLQQSTAETSENLTVQISAPGYLSYTDSIPSTARLSPPKPNYPSHSHLSHPKRFASQKSPMLPQVGTRNSSNQASSATLLELWAKKHHELLEHYTKLVWGTADAINLPNRENGTSQYSFASSTSDVDGSSNPERPSVIINKRNVVSTSASNHFPPGNVPSLTPISAKLPPNITQQPPVVPGKYPWKVIHNVNSFTFNNGASETPNRYKSTMPNLARPNTTNTLVPIKPIPEYPSSNELTKRSLLQEAKHPANIDMGNTFLKSYPSHLHPMPVLDQLSMRLFPHQRPMPMHPLRKRSQLSYQPQFPPLHQGFKSLRPTTGTSSIPTNTVPQPQQTPLNRHGNYGDSTYAYVTPYGEFQDREPHLRPWSAFVKHSGAKHTPRPQSYSYKDCTSQNMPTNASTSHFASGYPSNSGPSASPAHTVELPDTVRKGMQPRHNVSPLYGEGSTSTSFGNGSPKSSFPHGPVSCRICPEAAGFLCAGCRTLAYCSVRCQAMHWPTHCSECKP